MANTFSLDLELSSSQYAKIADNASLSITGDLTIECWVKLESLASTIGARQFFVAKFEDNSNRRSFFFDQENTTDKYGIGIYSDGSTLTSALATSVLTTGVWTHIAVSYNAAAGTCAFYLNSVADGTGSSLATSIHDNTSDFTIGASNTLSTPSRFVDGKIDEVRVWNDIRTAQEIAANYNKELVGNEANLVGYWKLNNDYLDETTNNNDLTASGSPVFSTDVPFVGGGSGLQSKIW